MSNNRQTARFSTQINIRGQFQVFFNLKVILLIITQNAMTCSFKEERKPIQNKNQYNDTQACSAIANASFSLR